MSLYRQVGGFSSRSLLAGVLAAALLGALIGFLVGRGSVEPPATAEAVAAARAELRPVSAGLELVPIEYEGALRGGRVVAETELEATRAAVLRAKAELEAVAEDMNAIDPSGYAAATRSIARLVAAIEAQASIARVNALAREASARVDALASGG
jgi:hypothetical protein